MDGRDPELEKSQLIVELHLVIDQGSSWFASIPVKAAGPSDCQAIVGSCENSDCSTIP
jgi:hypothetical protein